MRSVLASQTIPKTLFKSKTSSLSLKWTLVLNKLSGSNLSANFEFEVVKKYSLFTPNIFESIFIKLKTSRNKFQIIGNIYRPNTNPHANIKVFNETLSLLLNKIRSDPEFKNCEGLTLIGDFNINLLQYLSHSETSNYLEILLSNELLPLITLPTRITQRSATLIDHISSSIKDDKDNSGILINDLSDHFATFYIRDLKVEKCPKQKIKIRKINQENTYAFKSLL